MAERGLSGRIMNSAKANSPITAHTCSAGRWDSNRYNHRWVPTSAADIVWPAAQTPPAEAAPL